MTPDSLDMVLSHDIYRLATWLAGRPQTDPPWRVMAIDGTGDPDLWLARLRSALRHDPEALLLRPSGPLSQDMIKFLAVIIETGHSVFLRGLAPEDASRLLEALGPAAELAGDFLARLPGGTLCVEASYLVIAQAPRPADLAAGFDRYETVTEDMRVSAPAPARAGDSVQLRLVENQEGAHIAGRMVILPVMPDGASASAIAFAAFPEMPPAVAIAATPARVHRIDTVALVDENGADLPDVCRYRLYLDVPVEFANLLPKDAWLGLTAEGRRPMVTFRA